MEGGVGMLYQKEPTRCSHSGPATTCRRAQELKGASYQAGEKQPAQRSGGGRGNGRRVPRKWQEEGQAGGNRGEAR